MNKLNSYCTQNDFHKVVLEIRLGKTALGGARSHKISKNDTKLMISPLGISRSSLEAWEFYGSLYDP